MKCPKCHSEMEAVKVKGGEVDRCASCKGLWFDLLEEEKFISQAKSIDTGDSTIGEATNTIDRINCPVCKNTPMIRMVDSRQHHIWFESCPSCFGRFYDAGEFRDLSSHTLLDIIRDVFTPERK